MNGVKATCAAQIPEEVQQYIWASQEFLYDMCIGADSAIEFLAGAVVFGAVEQEVGYRFLRLPAAGADR
jgi:hypothetical protein